MKKNSNYTIDEELHKLIKNEAIRRDRSKSFVVNEILNKHYKRYKK